DVRTLSRSDVRSSLVALTPPHAHYCRTGFLPVRTAWKAVLPWRLQLHFAAQAQPAAERAEDVPVFRLGDVAFGRPPVVCITGGKRERRVGAAFAVRMDHVVAGCQFICGSRAAEG